MALTGFNPNELRNSINGIKDSYDALVNALGDQMQSKFVNGMSRNWACNEAQQFFTNALKPAVDSLLKAADDVYTSVVEAMNSAGKGWGTRTQTDYSPVAFSPRGKKIDVSCIRENINGVRGIDVSNATATAGQLATIASSASNALDKAVAAVSNCGFLGGDQAGTLQTSLKTIQKNINTAVNDLTTQVKSAIDTSASNYGDLAGQVSNAFNAE